MCVCVCENININSTGPKMSKSFVNFFAFDVELKGKTIEKPIFINIYIYYFYYILFHLTLSTYTFIAEFRSMMKNKTTFLELVQK